MAEGCLNSWKLVSCCSATRQHAAGPKRWGRWPTLITLALRHHTQLLQPPSSQATLPIARLTGTATISVCNHCQSMRAMNEGGLLALPLSLLLRKIPGLPTHLPSSRRDESAGRQPPQCLSWAAGLPSQCGELAGKGATPPSPGNEWVPRHAPTSCRLPHRPPPTVKPALHCSSYADKFSPIPSCDS